MNKSLGQIIQEFEAVCDELEESEIEPLVMTDLFRELRGEISDKVDAWIAYMDSLETYKKHVEERVEKLTKRKKTIAGLQEQRKAYLLHCIELTKLPELKGTEGAIKVYRNSQPRLDFKMPLEKNPTAISFPTSLPAK